MVFRFKDGSVLDETVVFFLTDHGISHARGKQFLYDEGIHVPLVVRLEGTNVAEGKELLKNSGLAITAADDINDGAKKAVAAAKKAA